MDLPSPKKRKASLQERAPDILDSISDADFTYFGASDYPAMLTDMSEPPPYLFRKGPLWPIPTDAVAVVGPRRCSAEGRDFAEKMAAGLAGHGITIVSGGAVGVDCAAHKGALSVSGRTVLVAATGIDRCYPCENAKLFQEVKEKGCVITELLPGAPPRRDFFPTRNRIIAALSKAVIVVEGEIKSGTHSTARHAARFGRLLFTFAGAGAKSNLRELPDFLRESGAVFLAKPDPDPILTALSYITAAVAPG
jgi:DNA processing protein